MKSPATVIRNIGCRETALHPVTHPMRQRLLSVLIITLWVLLPDKVLGAENSAVLPSPTRLGPKELAVVINDMDPLSRKIGEYYRDQRHIPVTNIIHIRFEPGHSNLPQTEFNRIKAEVDHQTPPWIRAYALTWTAPYRVDCMSITTAFAAGFDQRYCATGCGPTLLSPYFNSTNGAPYSTLKIRPTMALAGKDFDQVKKLIDRGVASDGTFPAGVGYLVKTTDKERNVRSSLYPEIEKFLGKWTDLRIINADYIEDRKNILFYFTGAADVQKIGTNRFLPGAVADHLTSSGGRLTDSDQMSSLRWLEAGATGSYGTVVEPCNFLPKFPHPGILIERYLKGDTLVEAYWKSVAWPGQGIFIGEPLAAPFRKDRK